MTSVYVIEADNGEVKVGISKYPLSRLPTIVREYGPRRGFATARVVAYFDCEDALAVEVWSHRFLRDWWKGGEWFGCSPSVAIAAVLTAGFVNAEDLSARWPAHEAWLARRRRKVALCSGDATGGRHGLSIPAPHQPR